MSRLSGRWRRFPPSGEALSTHISDLSGNPQVGGSGVANSLSKREAVSKEQ
jgi:hypothetical protein